MITKELVFDLEFTSVLDVSATSTRGSDYLELVGGEDIEYLTRDKKGRSLVFYGPVPDCLYDPARHVYQAAINAGLHVRFANRIVRDVVTSAQ